MRCSWFTFLFLLLPLALSAQESGYWESFPLPGTDGPVYASQATPEGTIILGGAFNWVEDKKVRGLVAWNSDGETWLPIGQGVNGTVYALALDRNALYVGGDFTEAFNADGSSVQVNGIARWENGRWHPLGGGVVRTFGPATVRAIAVDSIRGGVFIGGAFDGVRQTGGVDLQTPNVAYWNGSSWEPLGEGMPGGAFPSEVFALAYNASLEQLYVGGRFPDFWKGKNLSRWNVSRAQWETIGDITGCPFFDTYCQSGAADGVVYALKLLGKYTLLVGGNFNRTDTLSGGGLGYYDISDSLWKPAPVTDGIVYTFSADILSYIAGTFQTVTWNGKTDSMRIASYFPLNDPPLSNPFFATPYMHDIQGDIYTISKSKGKLLAGGTITGAQGDPLKPGNVFTRNLLYEATSSWTVPHESKRLGLALLPEKHVALTARKDNLLVLYAPGLIGAGTLAPEGDLVLLNLDSYTYTSIDGSFNGTVYAIALHGDKLYVVGDFDEVETKGGPVATGPVAVCSLGLSNCWSAPYNQPVHVQSGTLRALAVTDTALVLGGDFIAGSSTDPIWGIGYYKADGWHTMAPGYWALYPSQPGYIKPGINTGTVASLEIVNQSIWAGGSFVYVDSVYAERLAYWDGTRWHKPASTIPLADVKAMKARGNTLFLLHDSGISLLDIPSRTWIKTPEHDQPVDISVYTDDEGNVVDIDTSAGVLHTLTPVSPAEAYVAGHFEQIGNLPTAHMAFWKDSTWNAIPPPTIALGSSGKPVFYTAEARGLDVYAGGRFDSVAGLPSSHLALWHAAPPEYATVNIRILPQEAFHAGNKVLSYGTPRVGEPMDLKAQPAPEWYFLGWKFEQVESSMYWDFNKHDVIVTVGMKPATITAYFARISVDTGKVRFLYPDLENPVRWIQPPNDTLIEGNTVRIEVPFAFTGPAGGKLKALLTDGLTGDTLAFPSVRGAGPNPFDQNVLRTTEDKLVFLWDTDGMAWKPRQNVHPADDLDRDPAFHRQLRLKLIHDLQNLSMSLPNTPEVTFFFPVTVRPRPLILVHGLWSQASTWDAMKKYPEHGIYTFAVGDGAAPGIMDTGKLPWPPFTSTTLAQNASTLDTYIEGIRKQTGAQEVDLIAHSMGGLISRQYIHSEMSREAVDFWNPRPPVRFLFTLGTPHWGSSCADLLYGAGSLYGVYKLAKGMITSAASIKTGQWYNIPKGLYGIISGVKSIVGYGRMNIWQLTTWYGRTFNRSVTMRKGVRVFGLGGYYWNTTCGGGPGDQVVGLWSALPYRIAGMPADSFFVSKTRMQPLKHTAMTESLEIYRSLIRPAIDGGQLPEGGTYDINKMLADSLEAPMFYPVLGVDTLLTAATSITLPFSVDMSGTSLEAFFMAPEGWQWELRDPTGAVRDSIQPGSPRLPYPGLGFLHVPNPDRGSWTLSGNAIMGNTGRIIAGAAIAYPEMYLHYEVNPDSTPPFIRGYLRNQQGQILPADSIFLFMAPEDTTDVEVQAARMGDDGQHFDNVAHDGIFGTTLPASQDSTRWFVMLAYYQNRVFHAVNQVLMLSEASTPIEESPENYGFRLEDLYPVPTPEHATLRVSIPRTGALNVAIYDLLGRQVHRRHLALQPGIHTLTLSTRGLSAGVYVLELRFQDQRIFRLWPVVK